MFQNYKHQIYIILSATLLSAFSLVSIIMATSPTEASAFTFGFFYLSVFLFSFGCFTLLGLGIRRWLAPKMFIQNFFVSLRQAVLVAFLIVASLLLLSHHLLFWWVEVSLILLLLSVEFFMSLKS